MRRFWEEIDFPISVLGPVLRVALARLAARRAREGSGLGFTNGAGFSVGMASVGLNDASFDASRAAVRAASCALRSAARRWERFMMIDSRNRKGPDAR